MSMCIAREKAHKHVLIENCLLVLKGTHICALYAAMVQDIIDRVRATIKQPGMSKRKLALLSGLHRNTLREADADDWNPSASTLAALEPIIMACEKDRAA